MKLVLATSNGALALEESLSDRAGPWGTTQNQAGPGFPIQSL